MKRFLLPVAFLFAAMFVCAQNSAVKEAKRKMDTAPLEAEAAILPALTDPETMLKADTWNVAGRIQKNIFDKQQENIWLGLESDTMKMYNSLVQMCNYFITCDDLEQIPNEKGKVKVKYRKENSTTIDQNRLYLIEGGNFFYLAGDDAKALESWSLYIDLSNVPMMETFNYMETDTLIPMIAYYATVAAIRAKDYDATIKYSEIASASDYSQEVAEYAATAYLAKSDTVGWENYVKGCVERFPNNQYFFSTLINHYIMNDNLDIAEEYGKEMLANNPDNAQTLFVVGYIYMLLKDYERAIELMDKSISIDATNPNTFSAIGGVYIELAQDAAEKIPVNMNDPAYKSTSDEYFALVEKARDYYEQARLLAPDNKELWLRSLFSIYYALNDPKFEEIEKMMEGQ